MGQDEDQSAFVEKEKFLQRTPVIHNKNKRKERGFRGGPSGFEGEEENSPSRKQPPKTMSRIRARKAKLTFVKKQYHHEQMDSLLDRFQSSSHTRPRRMQSQKSTPPPPSPAFQREEKR